MRTTATVLLLAAVVVLVCVACTLRTRSLRDGLLAAAIVVGAFVAVSTELLSLADGLRPLPLLVVWLLGGAGAVATLIPVRDRVPALLRRLRESWTWVTGLLAAVLAVPFVVGVFSAPNNWDSMTYHLARVAHWADAGSIGFYATTDDRQLWSTPLSEYGILHLYVLGGSDRFSFLVQWAGFVVSVVAVTVIARQLGLSARTQVLAGFLAASTPMAILQASTTQNDLTAAAFTLALVALLLGRLPEARRAALPWVVLTGAGVGAAILVKPTAAVFLVPFALRWLWAGGRRSETGRRVVAGLALCAVALLVAGPHLVRTTRLYDTPLGSGSVTTNSSYGVSSTVENLVRNLAVNAAVPVSSINTRTSKAVVSGLDAVGLDANDPGSTFTNSGFGIDFEIHEDYTGNFALTILVLVALVVVAVRPGPRRRAGAYALCVAVSFLLYCAVFAWQPWGGRLLLPWFLLGTVVVAAAVDGLSRRVPLLLGAVTLLGAVPWFVNSGLRPLVGSGSVLTTARTAQYFASRPELQAPYVAAARQLAGSGAGEVALAQGGDSWEYPFWRLLREDGSSAALHDIQVTNESRSLQSGAAYQALVCTVACTPPAGWKSTDYGNSVIVAVPPG